MPYNFAADSFHTNKLVADFLQAKFDFRGKTAFCVFEPLYEGLRGNVRWSSQAHWNARCGLPISVIELFSLGITAEALRAIIGL